MPGVGALRRRAGTEGVVSIRLRPGVLLGGWTVRVISIAPGERRKVVHSAQATTMATAQRIALRIERRLRKEWAAEAAARAAAERKRRRFRRPTRATRATRAKRTQPVGSGR
jgi:hypothetical protein